MSDFVLGGDGKLSATEIAMTEDQLMLIVALTANALGVTCNSSDQLHIARMLVDTVSEIVVVDDSRFMI